MTLKYDSAGNVVWADWVGSAAHPSQAQGLSLDAQGNVYTIAAIGQTASQGYPANVEFATVKYSGTGARQWIEYFPASSGGSNFPTKLAVTSQGDVYVAGTSSPATNSGSQVLTAKYDTSGNLLWSQLSPSAPAGFNSPSGFGLDSAENVYIGVVSSHFDPTIYKFDSAGNLLGSFVNTDIDDFNAFYVDALGNSYVGNCYAPGPNAVKIDPNGKELWNHSFAPTRCFSGIQVDSHGDVILAESISTGGGTGKEIGLTKLGPDGSLQWESIVAPGNSGVLVVDPTDQIYIAGSASTAFKYNAAGQQLWSQSYADGANFVTTDGAVLAVGNRFDITAASIRPDGSESDVITLSLSQP